MLVPVLLTTLVLDSAADEGMWLPAQLESMASGLQEAGLEVPLNELMDWRAGPLGAVANLGHCSSAFVSENGLLVTNGHCVRRFLAYASIGRRDLMRDGLLAATSEDELWAGPNASLRVLEKVEDVTEQVLDGITRRTSDADRYTTIQRNRKALVAECETQANRHCQVKSFYGGMEYQLITERELKDLRLVYAPPQSAVFFGGDRDNWMWPRHASDIALLRAYSAPDGSTSPYSDENVPYKPESFLSVSTEGITEGDFVFQAGYPASTHRNRTATEIIYAATRSYPDDLELINAILDILRAHAQSTPSVAQLVQNQIFTLANRAKYLEGMTEGLGRSDLVERKQKEAEALASWVAADRKRTKSYGDALEELTRTIEANQSLAERDRLLRMTSRETQLLGAIRRCYRLALETEKPDLERRGGYQARDVENIQNALLDLDHTLHLEAEKDLVRMLLQRIWRLGAEHRASPVHGWISAAGGVENALDRLFANPPELASGEARTAMLEMSPGDFEASTDPWVELAVVFERWIDQEADTSKAYYGAMTRLRPIYMAARRELAAGMVYPDANRTLRVSTGSLVGYAPSEAVYYSTHTSLLGLAAKAGRSPYSAPEWLLSSIDGAAESPYADEALGSVPVNFISDLDSSGGNSGSPTLDGKGRVVGLVFDRNYEAMAADWSYQADLTRSIHIDIRMGLWLLSETEGGQAILEELGVATK